MGASGEARAGTAASRPASRPGLIAASGAGAGRTRIPRLLPGQEQGQSIGQDVLEAEDPFLGPAQVLRIDHREVGIEALAHGEAGGGGGAGAAAHDRGVDGEAVEAEDPLDPALEPHLLGEAAGGQGGGPGGRELGLSGLGLGEARDHTLVRAGHQVQDLHGGEGRIGREAGGDPGQRAAHLEVHAVGADPRLGLDVEERVDLPRVGEVDDAPPDHVGLALEVEAAAVHLGPPHQDGLGRRSLQRQVRAGLEVREVVVDAQGARGPDLEVEAQPVGEGRGGGGYGPLGEELAGHVVAPPVHRLLHVDRPGQPLPVVVAEGADVGVEHGAQALGIAEGHVLDHRPQVEGGETALRVGRAAQQVDLAAGQGAAEALDLQSLLGEAHRPVGVLEAVGESPEAQPRALEGDAAFGPRRFGGAGQGQGDPGRSGAADAPGEGGQGAQVGGAARGEGQRTLGKEGGGALEVEVRPLAGEGRAPSR